MSKVLKLLNKAKSKREDQYVMAGSNDSIVLEETTDEYAESPEQAQENRFHLSPAIMMFCVILLGSFLMSFLALRELAQANQHMSQIATALKTEQLKIAKLQTALVDKAESNSEVETINVQLGELNSLMDEQMLLVKSVSDRQKLSELKIDDMKTTDRLLLDKILTINQSVKDVKSTLFDEGRER